MKRFVLFTLALLGFLLIPVAPAKAQATVFYVATAIDTINNESVKSNEVPAGVPKGTHTVNLTCNAPTSGTMSIVGFNFYRGSVSGGPYAKVNTTLTNACAFAETFSPPPAPTNLAATVT